MRISLFITCYNDTLFPETGKAVVRVLERLGHEVEFRAAQTCCGQMHYNTGYASDALSIMRHFVRVFEDAELICIPSSSCVAMIRDHYPKMAAETGDATLQGQVVALLPRVFEFSELLVDKLGITDVGAFYPHTVTLHTPCHALRSLHVREQPIALLRSVGGLRFVDLPRYDECCGFGGTFAVKNADVSVAMLNDKIGCIRETKADVCAATDNSCLMHIGGGLRRQNTGVRCLHIAEILAAKGTQPVTERIVVASQRREPKPSGARRSEGVPDSTVTKRTVVPSQRREPKASGGRRWGWGPSANKK